MFDRADLPLKILRHHFPQLAEQIVSPPESVAGGFSGADVYRIECAASQNFCLRRWPARQTSPARVIAIHDVLAKAHAGGISVVPVPVRSTSGSTLFEVDGSYWQLEPWMPGVADFQSAPGDDRLKSAMTHLARFHNAIRDWDPGSGVQQWFQSATRAPSPTIRRRLQMITDYAMSIDVLDRALADESDVRFQAAGARVLAWFRRTKDSVISDLKSVLEIPVPLQPCLRDLWHDHLLFRGSELSGLIDFGAMATDSVACDLSRLLGSIYGDDVSGWRRAIDHYACIRPLSDAEHRLSVPLDRSSVVLSGMTWLKRRYILRNAPNDLSRICERMETIIARFSD